MHKITWCKFILLATDFLTLFSSLFIAYEVLDIARGGRFYFPLEEFNAYVLIHASVSSSVYYGFGYDYGTILTVNRFGLS